MIGIRVIEGGCTTSVAPYCSLQCAALNCTAYAVDAVVISGPLNTDILVNNKLNAPLAFLVPVQNNERLSFVKKSPVILGNPDGNDLPLSSLYWIYRCEKLGNTNVVFPSPFPNSPKFPVVSSVHKLLSFIHLTNLG